MTLEIPQVFRYHVLTCLQSRPDGHPHGSCAQRGANGLYDYLANSLEKLGNPDIAKTVTGCLGFCLAGPVMVVYPEGIWYVPRTREDIDEIIQSHFVDNNPVERLIIVPRS